MEDTDHPTRALFPAVVITADVMATLLVILLDRVRAFGCTGLQGRISPQDSARSATGPILL